MTKDEYPRAGTTVEKLAALKTAFAADGTVTAGNASGINDGAAALVVSTAQKARDLGRRPLATILSYCTTGIDPMIMGMGPVAAIRKALQRARLSLDDIDLIEINEAFASVVLAWERELHPDMERVNVNGGAIALGHPLGSTGARLITTLVHELERSDKEVGLVTMCCGGGLGTGTLIQRL